MMTSQYPTIEYMNALHQFGSSRHPEVKKLHAKFSNQDPTFVGRAQVLHGLFKIRLAMKNQCDRPAFLSMLVERIADAYKRRRQQHSA